MLQHLDAGGVAIEDVGALRPALGHGRGIGVDGEEGLAMFGQHFADQTADHGLMTEALMAAIAQSAPEAKERVKAFLAPNGRWIVIDYFRLKPDTKNRSGHLLADFDAAVARHGLSVVERVDVTDNVVPSLAYARVLADRFDRRHVVARARAGLEQAMTKTYDALIIGGGHNGLVCAFYLAKAGLKVRIVEARDVVGGAAVTEEFAPGFRNSVASYTVSLLQPKVIADMKLADHGYRVIERPISNFLPQEDGGYLKLGGGLERTQAEFARFSKHDAQVLPEAEQPKHYKFLFP